MAKSKNPWKATFKGYDANEWLPWKNTSKWPSKKEWPETPSLDFDFSLDTKQEYSLESYPELNGETYPIQSSALESVKFDEKKGITRIRFVNSSKEYTYKTTPEEMMDLVKAESKGRHVAVVWNHNPHFRDRYYRRRKKTT